MEFGINLLKILFFLVTSYLCWKVYKNSRKPEETSPNDVYSQSEDLLDYLEEGSDFFLVEEGVWCWIEDGEAMTTKEFHLSHGGAIEDYERYIEGKKLH
jgi:hypothetical protein|tara:strand:- start:14 stop:310 length:297 start_codon:yes stop_codon:yes gene_type:complete